MLVVKRTTIGPIANGVSLRADGAPPLYSAWVMYSLKFSSMEVQCIKKISVTLPPKRWQLNVRSFLNSLRPAIIQ